MGGMVLETNMNEIVGQVEVQNRLEKSEVSRSVGGPVGGQTPASAFFSPQTKRL